MDGGNHDTYFLESDSITVPWAYITYKFSAKRANTTAETLDA